MGKIGRRNVSILKDGNVEESSDTDGIVYISTGNNHAWMVELSRVLISTGYDIDINEFLKRKNYGI